MNKLPTDACHEFMDRLALASVNVMSAAREECNHSAPDANPARAG
jgi:hypothetical protein